MKPSGKSTLNDFLTVAESGVDAILAASVFHRGTLTISQVKDCLAGAGMPVRAML